MSSKAAEINKLRRDEAAELKRSNELDRICFIHQISMAGLERRIEAGLFLKPGYHLKRKG